MLRRLQLPWSLVVAALCTTTVRRTTERLTVSWIFKHTDRLHSAPQGVCLSAPTTPRETTFFTKCTWQILAVPRPARRLPVRQPSTRQSPDHPPASLRDNPLASLLDNQAGDRLRSHRGSPLANLQINLVRSPRLSPAGSRRGSRLVNRSVDPLANLPDSRLEDLRANLLDSPRHSLPDSPLVVLPDSPQADLRHSLRTSRRRSQALNRLPHRSLAPPQSKDFLVAALQLENT